MGFVFSECMVSKPIMFFDVIKRLKGKSYRDFVVYFKRKYFLQYVKLLDNQHTSKYFFSTLYLNKFIDYKNLSETSVINRSRGIFGDIEALDQRLSDWAIQNPTEVGTYINQANMFMKHEFDLLGSGPVNISFPCNPVGIQGIKISNKIDHSPSRHILLDSSYKCIDWHIDYKSGYRWDPTRYYTSSRSYIRVKGADIKSPWELSRCQHLPILALAYRITGQEKYAREIYNTIVDWITNNPLCKGPNWNCPMDVGIRVANWFVALELLDEFLPKNILKYRDLILPSFVQHFHYLKNNFEWTSRLTSNHYLSDIAGFAFCAHYIPYLRNRDSILRFVKKEFVVELEKQTNSEGMNTEASLSYHKLVLEIFGFVALLDNCQFMQKEESYLRRLKRCFEFTEAIMRADGTAPQIGDNDSGLFLNFSVRPPSDYLHLLVLERKLFNAFIQTNFELSSLIETPIFGVAQKKLVKNKELFHYLYKKSGFSVIKNHHFYFCFYCGPNGQRGNGGHCHNDRLSFNIWYKGQDIFVDGGTGVYTSFPEIRNKFRSTQFHNTVMVDGKEQNRFYEDGYLFGCHEDITQTYIDSKHFGDQVKMSGSHNGYARLQPSVEHSRLLDFDVGKRVLVINDFVNEPLPSVAWFNIHKHEGIKKSDEGVYSPLFSIEFSGSDYFEVFEDCYSPAYGKIDQDVSLRVKVRFTKNLTTFIKLK